MSDYIIHNIKLSVVPKFDFDKLVEMDKPVDKFPNYYLDKIIGGKGNELLLNRTRRNGGEEHVPKGKNRRKSFRTHQNDHRHTRLQKANMHTL